MRSTLLDCCVLCAVHLMGSCCYLCRAALFRLVHAHCPGTGQACRLVKSCVRKLAFFGSTALCRLLCVGWTVNITRAHCAGNTGTVVLTFYLTDVSALRIVGRVMFWRGHSGSESIEPVEWHPIQQPGCLHSVLVQGGPLHMLLRAVFLLVLRVASISVSCCGAQWRHCCHG